MGLWKCISHIVICNLSKAVWERVFTQIKHNCLFHVSCGWTERKNSDDVELCSHLWFPSTASPRLACSLQLHKHENVSAASGSSAIFKTHFISLAPPPPPFFPLSFYLSALTQRRVEVNGWECPTITLVFFCFWLRGGRKRTALSVGRRQRRECSYIGWIKQGCNPLYHLQWLQ